MSALGEGRHRWRAGTGTASWLPLDGRDHHDGRLLVADSWRVVDGRVRGLERHRARFVGAAATYRGDVDAAFSDVVAAVPLTGDWFPRIELRDAIDGTQVVLWLRPTPPVSGEVDVATAPYDPRTIPLIKGPDLEALQLLRVAVQPWGAGEAVIVDAQGRIIEGAYSGLLWWRGETLVRPHATTPRIRSVTVDLVLEAAHRAGVTVREEHARPDDLADCELWVLSALHGLRVARRWVDGPVLGPARHAPRGRKWLEIASVIPEPHPLYPDRGTPTLGGINSGRVGDHPQ